MKVFLGFLRNLVDFISGESKYRLRQMPCGLAPPVVWWDYSVLAPQSNTVFLKALVKDIASSLFYGIMLLPYLRGKPTLKTLPVLSLLIVF